MLWGRDTQLEILKRLLGERIPSAHTTRLYSIEGESGMGKTALLSELLAFLKTLPRPMIIVEAAGWANIPDDQMEEFLAGCVRTIGFACPNLLEAEGWRAYWRRVLQESTEAMPGVLVVIDSFDRLTPAKRVFLKEAVVDPLRPFSLSHDARFVIASTAPPDEGQLEAYWKGYDLQRFVLKPLDDSALAAWLRAGHMSVELLADLRAKTQGIPTKVLAYMDTKRDEHVEELAVRAEAELLNKFTDRERQIAALAALSDIATDGILEYFLGEGEGRSALKWLLRDSGLKGGETDDGFHMAEEPRSLLRAWYLRRFPTQFAQTQSRLQGLRTMASSFGGTRERKILGQLSLLKNFSEHLVEAIWDDTSDSVLRYIKNNPSYFEAHGELWRLSPDIISAGQMAAELIHPEEREAFLSKVNELWLHRREELFHKMEEAERAIIQEREQLGKTNADLEQLEPKVLGLRARLKNLISMGRRQLMASADGIREGWNLAGIALVVLGVIWIYVSVLITHIVSMAHTAMGAGLIFIGLIAPQVGRSQVQALANVPKPENVPTVSPEVAVVQKNLHFMEMRFTAMEHKKRALTARIADHKQAVSTCEEYLQNPYI